MGLRTFTRSGFRVMVLYLGTNFKVNDNQEGANQRNPSISTDGAGKFVITWEDRRNGDYDIYAQRFTGDGNVLGANFKVNDDQGNADQLIPSICTDGGGNFVITWTDWQSGDSDIYVQRYSSIGAKLGTNFKINDDKGLAFSTSITADDRGNFVITWREERYASYDIYAQRCSSDGNVLGTNFKVNEDNGPTYSPSISSDNNGNFVIVWVDDRYIGSDIYAQHYSSDGSTVETNFIVNDDQGCSNQWYPIISIDSTGNFVIVWQDERNNGFSDVYAQRYSSGGTALGTNFKVNDDNGFSGQIVPSISSDKVGNFVITWEDSRNGQHDIYAQRYASDGTALGTNFKVNIDQDNVGFKLPSVCTNSNGNFVITWGRNDYMNGISDIYAQRYLSDGTALGTNFKVNDDQGIVNRWPYPTISKGFCNNFIISWQDDRNGDPDIYAQRYSSDGTELGTNFKVNDDQGTARQNSPSISIDVSSNFVITWSDWRNGDSDIYSQRYSSDGTELGANFKVNVDQGNITQWGSSISTDSSGHFVITWVDERNGDSDIFAQYYSSDGIAVGSNFLITNNSKKKQTWPDVKLWNNRIYNTWNDNHAEGTGYDIWANVLDWENPVGISDNLSQVPTAFILSQNYPNPFNSSTKISYSLLKSGFVLLIIYDILGNEIQSIKNEFQDAGTYSVDFEASEISSGIYFYEFQVDRYFIETKKMMHLR